MRKERVPPRPLLRWHGGKWRLASWIVSHLPPHLIYVEPFGGAASILLHKPRSVTEVYNDLDATLQQLFGVLRDDALSARLIRQLRLTPFSRREFDESYEPSTDPVERARRTIVRSFMGYGSDGTAGVYRTGFRRQRSTCGSTPAREWAGYPAALEAIVDRLTGVTFEAAPATEIIRQFDDARAVFYVDPPYLPETRSTGNRRRGQGFHVYQHELDRDDHVELLDLLKSVRGMVALSGYPSSVYDDMLYSWAKVQRRARADGNRPRTECLWLNPAAVAALPSPSLLDTIA
ncbi:MAG: DNA adenine methylase [Sphingomonadaceae bacterium]|nr:DNA adenine methylase [Sphingomonadaceae bacterium]